MPKMIASREIRYGSRTVMPGETFEALEQHVRILRATKKADHPPAEPESPPQRAGKFRRAVLPPDPEPPAPAAAPAPAPVPPMSTESAPALMPVEPAREAASGRYARRDLRATDETETQ